MIQIKKETIINSTPEKVWYFLTHLQKENNYKNWHPTDHVKMALVTGEGNKKGSKLYIEEYIGKTLLRLPYEIARVEKNKYIEYVAWFPFSLLHLGKGYFRIEALSRNTIKLTADVELGYTNPFFMFLDKIILLFIHAQDLEKHMTKEGENMKSLLENSPST